MNIGKASKLSELTVKAVRYYDNIGLVKPHQNIFSGYREYNDEDVLKLKFVGKARKFNFSIDECRELLSLYENKSRPSKDVKKFNPDKEMPKIVNSTSLQFLTIPRLSIIFSLLMISIFVFVQPAYSSKIPFSTIFPFNEQLRATPPDKQSFFTFFRIANFYKPFNLK